MNNLSQHPESDIKLDQLRPEDASGVAECFKAVYGDSYPIKIFYDTDQLIEATRNGEYLTIVARTSSGQILAVGNLFLLRHINETH